MAKLTEPMIEWAYEKRLEGYPFRDIAGALHVGCATIFGALQKRGLVRELPPLHYPEEETRRPFWDGCPERPVSR